MSCSFLQMTCRTSKGAMTSHLYQIRLKALLCPFFACQVFFSCKKNLKTAKEKGSVPVEPTKILGKARENTKEKPKLGMSLLQFFPGNPPKPRKGGRGYPNLFRKIQDPNRNWKLEPPDLPFRERKTPRSSFP